MPESPHGGRAAGEFALKGSSPGSGRPNPTRGACAAAGSDGNGLPCAHSCLAHTPSVAYVRKTSRLQDEAATGTEDGIGINSAQICAYSTKPVLYCKAASSSDGRGYTPASDASALLGDLSQGQRHGFSVEGATAPQGESNCAAYRLRKGQTHRSTSRKWGWDGCARSTEGSGLQSMNRPVLTLNKSKKKDPPKVETPKSFRQMRKALQSRWPDLFDKERPVPLAVGIHAEIAKATGFNEKKVSKFLGYWTHRSRYQSALVQCDSRTDLNGDIC